MNTISFKVIDTAGLEEDAKDARRCEREHGIAVAADVFGIAYRDRPKAFNLAAVQGVQKRIFPGIKYKRDLFQVRPVAPVIGIARDSVPEERSVVVVFEAFEPVGAGSYGIEIEFVQKHPVGSDLPPEVFGYDALSKVFNKRGIGGAES